MAFNDNININGNNYSRILTIIEIGGIGITTTDITSVVKGISYTETQDKQFDYTIGSLRPSHFGAGNIVAEGSLTLTDAGLALLNNLAVKGGLPSYLYLGQAGSIKITVSYTTYNKVIKTDILEEVHFTTYTNGVNTDDVLNSREISMMIGKVNIGVI